MATEQEVLKQPELTEAEKQEKARQYKLQVRIDTLNKLKEIRNLWLYLLHQKYPNRTERRHFITAFIKDAKFSEDLINEVIAYQEALVKEDK